MAFGSCVVRLWQRGVCVYHVRFCSSLWSVSHLRLCSCIEETCLHAWWNASLTVCRCRGERACVTMSIKCARRTQKPQKTSKSEEMYFLLFFLSLFCFQLPCFLIALPVFFRGRICDITWGAEQSSIVGWALKGTLWRSGTPLGGPSRSILDETESARSSPESFPPVVERKCFFKCSNNT